MTLQEVELKNFREKNLESDRIEQLKPEKRELVDAALSVLQKIVTRPDYRFATDVFTGGRTKGAPATIEVSFEHDGRRFRYGVDLLPGKIYGEYLFEEIDYVEELVFGREGEDLVFNEEKFPDEEAQYEDTLRPHELLLRVVEGNDAAETARAFFAQTPGTDRVLVVTGAAGFIGSVMVRKLNDAGHKNLIVVDEFSRADKNRNLDNKDYRERIERSDFIEWFGKNADRVEAVFHLGARTDTTEQSVEIFDRLNLNYSKAIWRVCARHDIPLLYASSAATYGLGEHGYVDRHDIVDQLEPLNPYGRSKNDFDQWALQQDSTPPFWAGFKFFNVYGPNEYHKGRMASVIMHTARQIKKTGAMKLFRSHREDVKDGEQRRDFIYVKDVVDLLHFFYQNQQPEKSGLYNLGTGTARTFYDLAANTFRSMDRELDISFIDTPADIRDTYQYFTEADMQKVRDYGYHQDFYTLEAGIDDYVRNYLENESIY